MDASLLDFMTRLEDAESVEAAWALTRDFMRGFGVQWLHFAYVPLTGRQDGQCSPCLSTLPEAWLAHYADRGFGRVNTSAAHCKTRLAPLLTGPDFVPRRSERLMREWADDSRSIGVRSEFVFPLRGHPGASFGGLSGLSSLPRRRAERWAASIGGVLKLAVYAADLRLVRLAHLSAASAARLSPREREVLLRLAQGLRNDRIAERMGISLPTVELHMRNARRKLSAATREQALARAIMLGLLTP